MLKQKDVESTALQLYPEIVVTDGSYSQDLHYDERSAFVKGYGMGFKRANGYYWNQAIHDPKDVVIWDNEVLEWSKEDDEKFVEIVTFVQKSLEEALINENKHLANIYTDRIHWLEDIQNRLTKCGLRHPQDWYGNSK